MCVGERSGKGNCECLVRRHAAALMTGGTFDTLHFHFQLVALPSRHVCPRSLDHKAAVAPLPASHSKPRISNQAIAMSASSAAAGAAASPPASPEPPRTALELKLPKLRSDKTEPKYRDRLKRSRDASEEALKKFRKLSQSHAGSESRQEHAQNMIESAITVLEAQKSEAALRVESLESVAQKAARRALSEEDIKKLEQDIRDWTKARTQQEALLQSAAAHRTSIIEQLSVVPWDKCQGVLEMLLALPVIHKRRSRPGQAQWRKDAFRFYDATRVIRHPEGREEEQAWDPIMRTWFKAGRMRAAHILPYAMTDETARCILGEDEGTNIIFDIRNCLPLWEPLESAFDKGVFVLVPVDEKQKAGGPTNYKLVLLEDSMRTLHLETPYPTTWAELDGTVLQFRNDCRPRQRYVYLSFVSRIIAARKLNYSKYSRTRLERTGTAWVSPGKWIRKSLIREVARIVGDHAVPNILEEAAFDDQEGPESPTKAKMMKAAEEWIMETFNMGAFGGESGMEEGDADEESEFVEEDRNFDEEEGPFDVFAN